MMSHAAARIGALGGRIKTAALLLSLGCLPTILCAQEPGVQAQNVLAGSRIFGVMGCGGCHSVNGVGGTTAPDLGSIEEQQTFFSLAAAMWNHLPQMSAQMKAQDIAAPRLAPWEAGDLIAFLTWLDYFDPPGDAESGKQVFIEKTCIVCHQVAGVGGVTGPSLDFLGQYGSPIQIATAMWNHGTAMSDTMRARGLRRPSFTAGELRDLLAYLEAASPDVPTRPVYVLPGSADAGRERFTDLGCIECHSAAGQGGTLAPDLGRSARYSNLIEFAAAMWNKAPRMTAAMERDGIPVPRLQDEDMADLVAYLTALRYFGDAGSRSRGERLVRDKGCRECHSAADFAETVGMDSPAAVVAALWNHTLVDDGGPAARADDWPTFSAAEMADLAAYLQSVGR